MSLFQSDLFPEMNLTYVEGVVNNLCLSMRRQLLVLATYGTWKRERQIDGEIANWCDARKALQKLLYWPVRDIVKLLYVLPEVTSSLVTANGMSTYPPYAFAWYSCDCSYMSKSSMCFLVRNTWRWSKKLPRLNNVFVTFRLHFAVLSSDTCLPIITTLYPNFHDELSPPRTFVTRWWKV